MRILIGLFVFVGHLACNSDQPGPVLGSQDPCAKSGVPFEGHYCLGSQSQPISSGMCSSVDGSDCPKPYNACVNNLCQIAPAATESDKILFATDPIQPGVAFQGAYVYNIMAKGRASLNDWCLTQAQQSTSLSMRFIRSWTAEIAAQGDGSYPIGSSITVFNSLFNAINTPQVVPYSSPTVGGGSYAPLSLLDKNGNTSSPINDTDTDPSAQNVDIYGGVWLGYTYASSAYAIGFNCPYIRQAGSFTSIEPYFFGSTCNPAQDPNPGVNNFWASSSSVANSYGGTAGYMTGFGIIPCISGPVGTYYFTLLDPSNYYFDPVDECAYIAVNPTGTSGGGPFCGSNPHNPTFHNGCDQAKGIVCLSDQGFSSP